MNVININLKGLSMVKLYILLLVACSLYLNGADPDNPDQHAAILKKWSGKQRNLSDLPDSDQANQHNQNEENGDQQKYLEEALSKYLDSFGSPED